MIPLSIMVRVVAGGQQSAENIVELRTLAHGQKSAAKNSNQFNMCRLTAGNWTARPPVAAEATGCAAEKWNSCQPNWSLPSPLNFCKTAQSRYCQSRKIPAVSQIEPPFIVS